MTRMQEKLDNILLVPQEESKSDFPNIFDADEVLLYSTSSRFTVAGLALFVPKSLTFEELIPLPVEICVSWFKYYEILFTILSIKAKLKVWTHSTE